MQNHFLSYSPSPLIIKNRYFANPPPPLAHDIISEQSLINYSVSVDAVVKDLAIPNLITSMQNEPKKELIGICFRFLDENIGRFSENTHTDIATYRLNQTRGWYSERKKEKTKISPDLLPKSWNRSKTLMVAARKLK